MSHLCFHSGVADQRPTFPHQTNLIQWRGSRGNLLSNLQSYYSHLLTWTSTQLVSLNHSITPHVYGTGTVLDLHYTLSVWSVPHTLFSWSVRYLIFSFFSLGSDFAESQSARVLTISQYRPAKWAYQELLVKVKSVQFVLDHCIRFLRLPNRIITRRSSNLWISFG